MSGERDLRRGIDEMAARMVKGHREQGVTLTHDQARKVVVQAVKTEDRRQSGG